MMNEWNDWCFRPRFCTCKVILGRGQLGLMMFKIMLIVVMMIIIMISTTTIMITKIMLNLLLYIAEEGPIWGGGGDVSVCVCVCNHADLDHNEASIWLR